MFDMQKMMQQAQAVQNVVLELQEKFKVIEVHGESGGGMVKATMTCDGRLKSVSVDDSLMGNDKETLEDLVVAAVNDASDAKEQEIQKQTADAMKDMGLPADTKLPF